jgi:hypothetical protein
MTKMDQLQDNMPQGDEEIIKSIQSLLAGTVSHMNTLLARNLVVNFQIGQKDNNPEGLFQLTMVTATRKYKVG